MASATMAQHEQNKATLAVVDQGLDTLVNQTGTMNTNARAIGTELSDQIEIAKDTNARMDVTDANINKATGQLVDLKKTGGSAICSWIVMILLVVLIIVVVVLPSSIFGV
jgi:hypothetical protein